MGVETKIQWCDHSASPWHGCSHRILEDGTEHPGCANCYAEDMAPRNPSILGVWGDGGVRVKSKSFVANLRRWNREAHRTGKRVSVFPSLCDPFEDRPELEPWRLEMFEVIDECPWVDLLLLTKRPENVRRMWPDVVGTRIQDFNNSEPNYRHNVWLLASISDQPSADAMIPPLLECRDLVPVLGVSAEPLLGPIDIFGTLHPAVQDLCMNCGWCGSGDRMNFGTYCSVGRNRYGEALCPNCECIAHVMSDGDGLLDWVIIGGESGRNARLCRVEWIRNLKDQCHAAGVPAFVKQLGSRPVQDDSDILGAPVDLSNVPLLPGASMKDSKGGDPAEWPEDLRVREFPKALVTA
jgi:protein gp37